MRVLNRCLLYVLAVTFLWSASAWAAPPDASPVGVRLPWTFAPEQSGVEATMDHAAGLGFLDGMAVGVGFSTRVLGELPVDGITLMSAGRLGPLGLGVGYSYVGEPGAFELGTHRLDMSVALRLFESFSLGLHALELTAAESEDAADPVDPVDPGSGSSAIAPTAPITEGLDGYVSMGLSTTYRPIRSLSLGLAVDRLNSPRLDGVEQAPLMATTVALRPGTERVAFGLEGRVSLEDTPSWAAGGTLRIMPVPGLIVAGYGRYGQESGQPEMLEWGGYLAIEQGFMSAAVTVDRADPSTSDGEVSMSVGGLVTVGTSPRPSIYRPSGRVVKLTIAGPVAERRPVELLAPAEMPFGYWLVLLDVLAHDSSVDGVLLDIRAAPLWAQSWELRQAIERLKAAGKSVTARVTWGDMRAMYLASVAERIYLHPAGGLMLNGLAITQTYLKGMLENLGVNAQFVKWDAYKSAPERLTQAAPSEPAREQTRELLQSFERRWHEAVGAGRGLTREQLDAVLASGPQTMTMAHEQRLVDRIVHDDALDEALSEDLGRPVRVVENYQPPRRSWRRWASPKRVAIVPVVGTIVDGRSSLFRSPILGVTTGEVDFVQAMQRAVADTDVVGIIIRVSSPGGSVVASERMHRAVTKAMETKPVIVSFGDSAASGGYYLACGANQILSSPLTITGSIGIFTGKADLSGLFAKIGVTSDTLRTNASADAQGMHRPWSDVELKRARDRLKTYYDLFVSHVAKGRKMEFDTAEARARGRVYVGERALALDLVDAEGSLWDAIAAMRELAGIEPGEAMDVGYGPERGFADKLALLLTGALGLSAEAPMPIPEAFGPIKRMLATLVSLEQGQLQARMPYDIEVK